MHIPEIEQGKNIESGCNEQYVLHLPGKLTFQINRYLSLVPQ